MHSALLNYLFGVTAFGGFDPWIVGNGETFTSFHMHVTCKLSFSFRRMSFSRFAFKRLGAVFCMHPTMETNR